MKDPFKKKVWISFAVIFISIVAASGAFYYFSNDLSAQSAKVVSEKDLVNEQDGAVGSLALLKANQAVAASYQTAIGQLLPDQYGLVAFGPWLTQIAEKYQVTVTYAFQGDAVPPNGNIPGTQPFTLTAESTSGSLTPFLMDIESQAQGYLVSFSSFDLTSDTNGQNISAQGTLFFR